MSGGEQITEKYRNDPRSTEDLIHLALMKDADKDNDDYWHPVWALQSRLPRILERVKELGDRPDAKSRDTAATLLGQNGLKDKVAVSECVDYLLGMISRETSPVVLTSLTFALGHLHDPACITTLLPLKQHPSADVRYALVHSLSGHDDERAIKTLIDLSSDEECDVRNWATFALGSQTEVNTAEIRDALVARLQEEDDEIRGEALVGLATRSDKRVVTPFLRELEIQTPEVLRNWVLIADTANAVVRTADQTGAKEWLAVLERLKSLRIGDASLVEKAIARCRAGPG
ncbi:MAG: hypothetical protein JWM99_1152 [Verrucomicrobiales bacterium]|nr:hypothetical protein [Verrucomicrobiales bacterium]